MLQVQGPRSNLRIRRTTRFPKTLLEKRRSRSSVQYVEISALSTNIGRVNQKSQSCHLLAKSTKQDAVCGKSACCTCWRTG